MILVTVLAAVLSFPSPAGTAAAKLFLTARPDGMLVMSWLEGAR